MSRALSRALALVVALALVARGVAGEPAVVGTPRTDGYVGFVCPPGYQNFTLWTGIRTKDDHYTCNPGVHWTGTFLGTAPEIKNAYVVGDFAEKGWQIRTPLIKVFDYTGMAKPASKPEGDAVKMTKNDTLDERGNTNWNACVPGLKAGMLFGFTLEVDTNCYPEAESQGLCKPESSCEGHGTLPTGQARCEPAKNFKKFRSEAAMIGEKMQVGEDDPFDHDSLAMDKDVSPLDTSDCVSTTKDGSHVAREYKGPTPQTLYDGDGNLTSIVHSYVWGTCWETCPLEDLKKNQNHVYVRSPPPPPSDSSASLGATEDARGGDGAVLACCIAAVGAAAALVATARRRRAREAALEPAESLPLL